jgi:hypothetical protein
MSPIRVGGELASETQQQRGVVISGGGGAGGPVPPATFRSQAVEVWCQRLWREEALRVLQRRPRKRQGISTAAGMATAYAPNRVWAVDFQFDATTDGRPIKIVSMVDEHTGEYLGGPLSRRSDDEASYEFIAIDRTRSTVTVIVATDD